MGADAICLRNPDDGCKSRSGLPMARDEYLFASFNAVEEGPEGIFRFKCAD